MTSWELVHVAMPCAICIWHNTKNQGLYNRRTVYMREDEETELGTGDCSEVRECMRSLFHDDMKPQR